MRVPIVLHTVGLLLRYFGAVFLVPALVDVLHRNWAEAAGFVLAGAAATATGEAARRLHRGTAELARIEGLAVVAFGWLVAALFGAIPYVWSGLGLVDAAFESMSGFTTTGATVLEDFGAYSEGLFLWRGLTQWLGGMGVIALFIAILPALAVAGRQLFFAEAPGPAEERLTPRIRQTAIALWSLYAGYTLAEVMLLWAVGLPLFDAVCNSFTTLAAGGFSPHPRSIGGYGNPAAEWVVVGFMFLAGASYPLQYRALRGRPLSLIRDEEFRVYAVVVLVAAGLLAAFVGVGQGGAATTGQAGTAAPAAGPADVAAAGPAAAGGFGGALELARRSLFQALTIVTTTGFATEDFDLWAEPARAVLLALMFMGGCAGSAAGGPKVVRLWLIAKFAFNELFRLIHPQAVRLVRLGGAVVAPEIMRSIVAFLLLYLLVFTISVLVVVAFGADLVTGITASIATLGNIGPGMGAVGPTGNYAHLHPVSKVVLLANMWIGRLEVVTVLVFLQPQVWRLARMRL